jgi:hypothetical protein
VLAVGRAIHQHGKASFAFRPVHVRAQHGTVAHWHGKVALDAESTYCECGRIGLDNRFRRVAAG